MLIFTRCFNVAKGGPHLSRALFVMKYFNHPATLVMCTARVGKKKHVCGYEYLVFDKEYEDAKLV